MKCAKLYLLPAQDLRDVSFQQFLAMNLGLAKCFLICNTIPRKDLYMYIYRYVYIYIDILSFLALLCISIGRAMSPFLRSWCGESLYFCNAIKMYRSKLQAGEIQIKSKGIRLISIWNHPSQIGGCGGGCWMLVVSATSNDLKNQALWPCAICMVHTGLTSFDHFPINIEHPFEHWVQVWSDSLLDGSNGSIYCNATMDCLHTNPADFIWNCRELYQLWANCSLARLLQQCSPGASHWLLYYAGCIELFTSHEIGGNLTTLDVNPDRIECNSNQIQIKLNDNQIKSFKTKSTLNLRCFGKM